MKRTMQKNSRHHNREK